MATPRKALAGQLGTVIAAGAFAALLIAAGSPATEQTPTCHGKEATYVGTAGRDRVRDDLGKDPELGKHPVLVLRGGNDVVRLEGTYAAVRTLTVCGGSGNDKVLIFEGVGARDHYIVGGAGNDQLGNSSPYPEESFIEGLTLRGRSGDDLLLGGSFPDRIRGGAGNDRAEAGNGDDNVTGGEGDDKLFGEGHDDRLKGGKGDDKLIGDSPFHQPGADRVKGGPGNDRCRAEKKRSCER